MEKNTCKKIEIIFKLKYHLLIQTRYGWRFSFFNLQWCFWIRVIKHVAKVAGAERIWKWLTIVEFQIIYEEILINACLFNYKTFCGAVVWSHITQHGPLIRNISSLMDCVEGADLQLLSVSFRNTTHNKTLYLYSYIWIADIFTY